MKVSDYAKALGVAVATLAITLAASYPMVAFYAYFVEPGHPQEFYNEAARWIAPWSSHILGPFLFLAFNYWLASRSSERNAMLFAAATIACFVIVDWSMLPMMGIPIGAVLTATLFVSLAGKAVGAFSGAWLGAQRRRANTA